VPELSDDEVDGVNADVWGKNRGLSWDQVQADAERVFNQLLAMVSQYGDQELRDPAQVGWYRNRSLLASIVGNSFTHPQTHVSWFHLQRGEPARAREIQEAMANAQVDIDGSPGSRAVAFYNLACFYALTGEPSQAVGLLRQAFPLRPDLVEWSKHDPDLASLREREDYQALYE
jgi:Protein of unknown function (DUF1706)